MLQKFKDAMAYCIAITSFFGGTYVVGSGALSIVDSHVAAVSVAAPVIESQTLPDNSSVSSQILRKLLR